MPGLYDGVSGLWGGTSGLWDGVAGLAPAPVVPLARGFDPLFNSAPALTYASTDLMVSRTDSTGRRAVRSRVSHTTGKWYAEFEATGSANLRFVGVVSSTFNQQGAGGAAGVNRCGLQGANLVASGSISIPAIFAAPGYIIRIAWDADHKVYWLQVNNNPWNVNPASDPVMGIGGLPTTGLVGPVYLGVTLRPVAGAGIRYRQPGDVGYSLPDGYQEWTDG